MLYRSKRAGHDRWSARAARQVRQACRLTAVAAGICWCALVGKEIAAEPSAATATPEKITASPPADEELYLVRSAEWLYEQWSLLEPVADDFPQTAAMLRGHALRLRQHVRDRRFDPVIAELYTDYLTSLDAYLRFLGRIDAIEAEAVVKASEDAFGSGLKGGYAGGTVYSGMRYEDASSGEAAAAALVVGLATTAFDAWGKAEARDRAKAEAVRVAAQEVDDQIRTGLYRAQSLSRDLAKRKGWGREEVGFELDESRIERILRMVAAADRRGFQAMCEAEALRRPRDPDARLAAAIAAAVVDTEEPTTDALLKLSGELLQAAALVPAHHTFDEDRATYVGEAARMALAARLKEISLASDLALDTAAGREAVRLARMALGYDPTDPGGYHRELLAAALLCHNELDEAVELGNEIADEAASPEYCYLMACLGSAAGQAKNGLTWLEQAIDLGYSDVVAARTDPLLAGLRASEPQAFRTLTEARWTWSIKWGVFNDDLNVTNTSRFALTNVTLSYELKQDARVWKGDLTVDRIAPGATHVWPNVVSIPGGRLTSRNAILTSDQNDRAGRSTGGLDTTSGVTMRSPNTDRRGTSQVPQQPSSAGNIPPSPAKPAAADGGGSSGPIEGSVATAAAIPVTRHSHVAETDQPGAVADRAHPNWRAAELSDSTPTTTSSPPDVGTAGAAADPSRNAFTANPSRTLPTVPRAGSSRWPYWAFVFAIIALWGIGGALCRALGGDPDERMPW